MQYKESKCCLKIIARLSECEHYLQENSTEMESLDDVKRRQRQSCSLTNVTDNLYDFFLHLTEEILKHLINENLLRHGKDLYTYCLTEVCSNTQLHEEFVSNVAKQSAEVEFDELTDFCDDVGDLDSKLQDFLQDLVLQADQINNVFKDLIQLYLNVLLAQFRKDAKSACKLEKKMAHRKQIKVSKPKASKSGLKSKSKKGSGRRAIITDFDSDEDVQARKQLRKHEAHEESPVTLLHQQNVRSTASSTSAYVESEEEASEQVITEKSSECLNVKPVSSEGDIQIATDTSDMCKKCQNEKDDEFIQCDSCDGWYHRRCAELQNHKKWKKYTKDDVNWFCKECD